MKRNTFKIIITATVLTFCMTTIGTARPIPAKELSSYIPEAEIPSLDLMNEGPSCLEQALQYIQTSDGMRFLIIVLAFISFILFLLTWRSTAKKGTELKVSQETTLKGDMIPKGVQKEDIVPYVLKGYRENLRVVYGYYGSLGTEEFIRWAYDRILHSNDFKPNFINEALLELRSGNMRDLYSYDYFAREFAKYELNLVENKRLFDTIREEKEREESLRIEMEKWAESQKLVSKELTYRMVFEDEIQPEDNHDN